MPAESTTSHCYPSSTINCTFAQPTSPTVPNFSESTPTYFQTVTLIQMVDFVDFTIMSSNFGKKDTATDAEGDLDGDGAVDFSDFLILARNFAT